MIINGFICLRDYKSILADKDFHVWTSNEIKHIFAVLKKTFQVDKHCS